MILRDNFPRTHQFGQKIFQVDAFTDRPFAGNPAGVCILLDSRDAIWMQQVAQEMNLAETAFLLPRADGYDLRWFTPTVEVDLCGHATLASAHILWETEILGIEEVARFYTRSGLLTATRSEEWITLDFPAELEMETVPPIDLQAVLGAKPLYIGKNRFDYLVELESEAEVRSLKPDLMRLASLPERGLIVTARSMDPLYDFVSRFFAPAVGIPEDPVTGSAHCCLGPFWQKRLGKSEFFAYQASARGGTIRVRVQGDRVLISGQAVTTLCGEILASPQFS